MSRRNVLASLLFLPLISQSQQPAPESAPATPTMAEVLAAASPEDWRPLDLDNTLYMELPAGRIIIELAPAFSPQHIRNIKTLVREGYFDGLAIVRSHDNYVVQWGDPEEDGEDKSKVRSLGSASQKVPAEFTVPAQGIPFTPLADRDGYAPQTGFSNGFHAARDPKKNIAWLCHCYGTVGVGRDMAADSGLGNSLYAVIGHAPRHLDRNIAVVGRVVQGIELLSTLPRGTGPLGFYEKAEQRVPIKSVRVAADVPEKERTPLEVLRTDTQTFTDLVETRRNRRDAWFKLPAGYVEVCNVPMVVRKKPQ